MAERIYGYPTIKLPIFVIAKSTFISIFDQKILYSIFFLRFCVTFLIIVAVFLVLSGAGRIFINIGILLNVFVLAPFAIALQRNIILDEDILSKPRESFLSNRSLYFGYFSFLFVIPIFYFRFFPVQPASSRC